MIYKLQGTIQHYAWGGSNFLPHFLNLQKDHQPYAEWWLGSHSSAPSKILVQDEWFELDEYLVNHAKQFLSATSIKQYGKKLPFLLKILDVAKPLSIQIHPTKQQAEIGFKQESDLNVPITAVERIYKDDNHKPEMMIALSEFWLLHGFKHKQQIINSLKAHASLSELVALLEKTGIQKFYSFVMQASQDNLQKWLQPIIETKQPLYQDNQLSLTDPDYWILFAIESLNIALNKLEAGLLCFYLFNIVQVLEGEGIYQAAGIPHAYLRGQNVELMAASDNVIRGGLTPKYINVEALLDIIDTQEITPEILKQAPNSNYIYPTPSKDFALEYISFSTNISSNQQAQEASILLVMHGKIELQYEKDKNIILNQGESVMITHQTDYIIKGLLDGYCMIATTN